MEIYIYIYIYIYGLPPFPVFYTIVLFFHSINISRSWCHLINWFVLKVFTHLINARNVDDINPLATNVIYVWSTYSWCFQITHNDAAQSAGLLWTSDQLVAETSTWQHTTLTTEKYPCPRWDLNPRSQQASGLWPLACWDLGFKSHRGHRYLSVVSIVCCQVEVSATSWSLVQRSSADCAASLCLI